jgi:hypothetical protein
VQWTDARHVPLPFSNALYLPIKIEFVWQMYATFSEFFAWTWGPSASTGRKGQGRKSGRWIKVRGLLLCFRGRRRLSA